MGVSSHDLTEIWSYLRRRTELFGEVELKSRTLFSPKQLSSTAQKMGIKHAALLLYSSQIAACAEATRRSTLNDREKSVYIPLLRITCTCTTIMGLNT